ncbi:MAG TPA: hypothetical protein VNW53_17400 [Phenylobacterium sp.]|jgi:hypothetical protein|uniref:hypothetical protein n=1 Tax=Phenylobacterium sp. TaxID=1871053 RepID=UPI002C1BA437|nr:hypothetical protein [Phenylobacterium sp.]HXA40779.1 hypothetical protein [Phenylobacterium sp.]
MSAARRLPPLAAAFVAVSVLAATAAAAQPAPGVITPLHPVVYDMETLRTGPLPQEFVKQMEPLHTLQAVEDLLKQNRVAFAWSRGPMSSATMPPDLVRAIDALPPHEVFVAPQSNGGWVMGVVLARR